MTASTLFPSVWLSKPTAATPYVSSNPSNIRIIQHPDGFVIVCYDPLIATTLEAEISAGRAALAHSEAGEGDGDA